MLGTSRIVPADKRNLRLLRVVCCSTRTNECYPLCDNGHKALCPLSMSAIARGRALAGACGRRLHRRQGCPTYYITHRGSSAANGGVHKRWILPILGALRGIANLYREGAAGCRADPRVKSGQILLQYQAWAAADTAVPRGEVLSSEGLRMMAI